MTALSFFMETLRLTTKAFKVGALLVPSRKHIAHRSDLFRPIGAKARFATQTHSEAAGDSPVTKAAFLERCTLDHVPTRGFSLEALQAAAEDVGLSPAWVARFDRGPVELVEWWREHELRTARALLLEKGDWRLVDSTVAALARAPSTQVPEYAWTRGRLLSFLQTIFRLRAPYRRFWPQALALQLQPNSWSQGLGVLTKAVDELAWFAGDRSADMQWYWRRAAVASLLQTTELYWIATQPDTTMLERNATSDSFQDSETWNFAQRQLADDSAFMTVWWRPNQNLSSRSQSEIVALLRILGQGASAWARAWSKGFS